MERERDHFKQRVEMMEATAKDFENRLQLLESPPPPTPEPEPPCARRRLTFAAEDPTLLSPQSVAPQTPISCEEEMEVRALSAEREEEFFRLCHHGGQPRPDVYAASVFMALTPFPVYKRWGRLVNWSGSNGKNYCLLI